MMIGPRYDVVLLVHPSDWHPKGLGDVPETLQAVGTLATDQEYRRARRQCKIYNRAPQAGRWAAVKARAAAIERQPFGNSEELTRRP